MFLESYMLWKGNNSPQNIGLTIVGYLYRQGIEKRSNGICMCSWFSTSYHCYDH